MSDEGLAIPGFDVSNRLSQELRAKASTDNLLRWLESAAPEPFFAWLHLFDPHTTYTPPGRFAKKFYQGSPERGAAPALGNVAAFQGSAHESVRRQFDRVRDPAYPKALYRAEVNYVDAQVGRLIRSLRQRGLYEDTAVLLIGDHGESLGEHDIYYDHKGLYDVSLRIPFIVRLPGFPAGIQVSQTVGQIDVVPTLEYLFGLEMPSARPRRGANLADALAGSHEPQVAEREWMIFESSHNKQVALRRGPWKAIYSIWSSEPPVLLFNLDEDPGEERNLADARPELVEELKPLVQRWIDQGMWGFGNPGFKKAFAEQLRALGYLRDGQ